MSSKNNKNVVMVVDDDMFVREIVRQALKSLVEVVEVGNGGEAISQYKKHNPNIVFLDIHLPQRSGMEILDELLTVDPSAYVVMLSADSSIENVSRSKKHGIHGFLTKPFSRERIIEHLHRCPTIVFED